MDNNTSPLQARSTFSGWIGVARSDITPPVGIYMREWGAATHSTAKSVHRPLFLTALTFQSEPDGKPLVLVAADLGFWRSRTLFQKLRSTLRERFSLEPAQLMFGLSHTHSSVTLTDPDPNLPGGHLLGPYMERLEAAATVAIQAALEHAEEALLDWHYSHCALASNRDLPDSAPGSPRFVCGYNPNADADDTLLVGRVTARSGKLLCVLVNYACHPTTLAWENTAISPDFIGAMRETIESATSAMAVFLQGASGELAPRYQYVDDPQVADRHGRHLGFSCLAALEDMDPPGKMLSFDRIVESGAPLAVWRYQDAPESATLKATEISVSLPLKDWPSAEELERQRSAAMDRALEERLRRKRDTRLALGNGDTCSVALWIWRVGNSLLVGVPEEAYSLLQKELRRRYSHTAIVCMNLVNDRVGGYLPPRELYGLDIYQVWRSPFARGSLEIVIEALAKEIERITAENVLPQVSATTP